MWFIAVINLLLGALASIHFRAMILLPLAGVAVIEAALFQYFIAAASWLGFFEATLLFIASFDLGYGCGVGLAAFRDLRRRRAGKPTAAPARKGH